MSMIYPHAYYDAMKAQIQEIIKPDGVEVFRTSITASENEEPFSKISGVMF